MKLHKSMHDQAYPRAGERSQSPKEGPTGTRTINTSSTVRLIRVYTKLAQAHAFFASGLLPVPHPTSFSANSAALIASDILRLPSSCLQQVASLTHSVYLLNSAHPFGNGHFAAASSSHPQPIMVPARPTNNTARTHLTELF